MIHFAVGLSQPKASINLKNLKKELTCAKIYNQCPELSFKKIALYLGLASICIAPSCWDTGTDINQGLSYLNGDFYTKHVNNKNDSIIDYNCTLTETTRKVMGNIESEEEVIYTYKCFEKDKFWGWITFSLVFLLPGMQQGFSVIRASRSLEACYHRIIGYVIGIVLFLLSPLFPVQVFLVKLFVFLTNGTEMKKISNVMTLFEATFETKYQLVLQLYIIFIRADRQPSMAQILGLSSSIVFMAISRLEEHFADNPNTPLLKKLTLLPQKLCLITFFCGSVAIVSSILQIISFLIVFGLVSILVFCLSCIWMKAKNSQGQILFEKYKGMRIGILVRDSIIFITLLVLLVLISNFPDTTIYSLELPFVAILNGSIIQTNLTDFIVQIKLSDIAVVKGNLANYVIPSILVTGVIYRVLSYKQIITPRETIQISNKNDQQEIYEIPRGALQNSPLEAEVVKVLIEGKTYIIPTDYLDIEKYPQESETKTMVKYSNAKDGCIKNLKKKVLCSIETPKPIKAYIVKIEDMKEITIAPKNNIDGQQNTVFE